MTPPALSAPPVPFAAPGPSAAPAPTAMAPPGAAPVESGTRLRIGPLDWSAYRQIATALTGQHVRLAYDRGALEFMTISPEHARLSRFFARLVAVLTEESGLPICSCGDMTCDREDLQRAVEPDECFYLANEPRIRGRQTLDLSVDPPPDLAIEIDLSPPKVNRAGIYAAIGVPELWRFDGSTLTAFVLRDGRYEPVERSAAFPFLPVADLKSFLDRRHQVDENTLLREFRLWVRERAGNS